MVTALFITVKTPISSRWLIFPADMVMTRGVLEFLWAIVPGECLLSSLVLTHLSDLPACSGGGCSSYLGVQQSSFWGLLGYIDDLGCFHGCRTIHCFSSSGEKIARGHWMRSPIDWSQLSTLRRKMLSFHVCDHVFYHKNGISRLVTWQVTTASLTEV